MSTPTAILCNFDARSGKSWNTFKADGKSRNVDRLRDRGESSQLRVLHLQFGIVLPEVLKYAQFSFLFNFLQRHSQTARAFAWHKQLPSALWLERCLASSLAIAIAVASQTSLSVHLGPLLAASARLGSASFVLSVYLPEQAPISRLTKYIFPIHMSAHLYLYTHMCVWVDVGVGVAVAQGHTAIKRAFLMIVAHSPRVMHSK